MPAEGRFKEGSRDSAPGRRTYDRHSHVMRKRQVTYGASSHGHVLDDCSGSSDGFLLSRCKRTVVKVPSSAEMGDATRELVVTLLGTFKLFDESLGRFLLVAYNWLECIQFFLGGINHVLNDFRRSSVSHLVPKFDQIIGE